VALNIGELVGYLKLDRKQWNAGILAARAQLKRLGAGNKDLNEVERAVGKVAKGFVTLATRIAAVGAGANVMVSVVGLLTAMSGALGLAVAAGFAAAGVMAAVKLGADGAKKAFEGLNPTLDRLKANVSKSFESALIPAVNNLKGLLPKLQGGLQQIATAVGGVATKVTAMLNSGAQSAQLQSILSLTARLVQNVGKAAAPVIAAFIRIGAVAMPILLQLTSGIGGAAERFNAWVQRMADTGNITQWIQTAIDAIKGFATVLDNIIGIFADVFGALQDAGVGLGGTIGVVVASIRDFLETAQGHDVLVALADAIAQVSALVGQVLTAALQAVAPLLPPLLDAFTQLATQAVPLLVGAVSFLAPVLLNIATFIQQNIDWIGPLAIALGVWTAAQWALNVALDANPIGLIIIAIGALIAIVATIITYWEPISGFFADLWNTVWKWTSDRITDIVDFIVNVWNSVVDWFKGLGSKISSAFSAVIDWFASLPGKISSFIASLPGILWNAFTSAFRFALNAVIQGIEWVIAEIIALPIQIAYGLFQLGSLLWDLMVSAWNFALNAVNTGVNAVVDFVLQLPGRVIDGLMVLGSLLIGLFTNAWNWALTTTTNLIFNIIDFVRTLPQRIIAGLSALGQMLSNTASSAWNWFISTMRSTAEGIWSFVRSIPGRIIDGLGDLGGMLWQAGKNIIDGFVRGIKAAAGAVYDVVDGILGKVRNLLPFSPAKEGPFSGKGWVLYSGMSIPQALAEGIRRTGGQAVQAANDVVTRVQKAFAGATAGTIASNTGGMAAAAREILNRINSGGDLFEDFSYRGNSDNVRRYNDELATSFYQNGGQLDATQITAFLQRVIDQQQRATVQIENYHPPADASPQEVATDLDWLSRTGG